MKKVFKKTIKSILISLLIFLTCMINGPTPVFASSVSDSFSDLTKINTSASSGYVLDNGTMQIYSSWGDSGSGIDGDVTISSNKNINTDTIAAGRSYADGVVYGVSSIGTNSVTTSSTPNGIDGEVLLMNMQSSASLLWPTAWWRMDEASGNALDSSGNGYTGTPTGTTIVTGKYNNARSFNGTSDYISTSITSAMSSMTVSAWVKSSDTTYSSDGSGIQEIVTKWASGNKSFDLRMANGALQCLISPGADSNGETETSTLTLDSNVWTHVACVYSDSTNSVTIYKDAVGQTFDNAVTMGGTTAIQIGRLTWAGTTQRFWKGSIDNVRVYNSALTAAQITNDKNAAPYHGNVGNYEFLRVASVVGSTVNFTTDIQRIYGASTSNADLTGQKIIIQRVPNYNNLTIDSGQTLTSSAWDGTTGGIIAFRVRGTLTNNGTISTNQKGFRGGVTKTSLPEGINGLSGLNGANGSTGSDGKCTTAAAGAAGGGSGGGAAGSTAGGNGGNGGAGKGGGGGGSSYSGQAGGAGGKGGGGGAGTTCWHNGGGGGGGASYDNGVETALNSNQLVLGPGGGQGAGGGGNGAGAPSDAVTQAGRGGAALGDKGAGGTGGTAGAAGVDGVSGQAGGGIIIIGATTFNNNNAGGVDASGGNGGNGGNGGGTTGAGGGGGGSGGTGGQGGRVLITTNTLSNVTNGIYAKGGNGGNGGNGGASSGGQAGGSGGTGGTYSTGGETGTGGNGGTGISGCCTAGGGGGGGGPAGYAGKIDINYQTSANGTANPTSTNTQQNFVVGSGGTSATIVSTNLLAGLTGIDGIDEFVYNLSSLPTNTSATVQFSQNGTSWYNSSGVENGTDSLSTGSNNTITVHNLTWSGSNFYYKIALSSDGVATPVLNDITLNYTTAGYTNTGTGASDLFATPNSLTGLTSGVNKLQLLYNGQEGTGIDGAITVGANSSINSTNLITGRTCTDVGTTGGDAPYYSVSALTATTATLTTSPSSACLRPGDEVLLINLQGAGANNVTNVGNYETLRIVSISGGTITFATSKTNYYGDGASDDTNLGIGATNQKVMLQRVPNYTNVTVSAGYNFYPDAYNYATGLGGVLFFRANGTVSIANTASINANSKGYTGGAGGVNSGTATYPGHGLFYTTGNDGKGGTGGAAGNAGTYSGGGGTGGTSTSAGGSGTSNIGAGGGGGGGNSVTSSGCGGAGGGGGGGAYSSGGGLGVKGGSTATNGTAGNGSQSGGGGIGAGACNGANYGGGAGGGAANYGVANLSKLYFGSGGGGGGNGGASTVYAGSAGGNGGGIITIYANTITVSGASGITNTGGSSASVTYFNGVYDAGCGGGGAGGSIKLVGGTVTLGSSLVTAGGGTTGGNCPGTGGAGGNGIIAVGGSSVTGTTTPTKTDISALSTGTYSASGSYTSINLLSGLSSIKSIDSFVHTLTLPAGTAVTAQFSQDGINWYNSSGEANGTNNLSSGTNTINLSALGWNGPYFYFKLAFTSDGSATPTISSISVNYTTATGSPTSSTWATCTPLQGNNWTIGSNCFFPKTGYNISHRNIDGVDNGNLTVSAYKTLTIKGDQIIVRNNGKQINVQGTIAINDIPIGGIGGNVRDYSGNNNDGQASGTTVVAGKYEKARYFNAPNDYILVPENDALEPAAITVTAWINPATRHTGNFISKGGNSGYRIRTGSGGVVQVLDRGATNILATTGFTYNAGTWYHVAFVGDASGLKLYINGTLNNSNGTAYGGPNNSTDLLLGRYSTTNTTESYNGLLDDVRIYNYARSEAQITEDMNNAPNPTGNPPVAWWRFEDGGQIKETNLWALDTDGDGWTMTYETQDKAQTDSPGTGWVRRKDTIGSIFGTGKDGSITFTTDTNLSTANSGTRSCADGGDAVSYNITAFGSTTLANDLSGTTATLSSAPSSGCLAAEDNVLIINAQGTASAYGNTGNYELLKIYSISGTTVTFTSTKKKNYGDGANDTNLGTATSNQRIIMQRIPQYNNVTINSGVTINASGWNGTKGGIVAFQVMGTLANSGTITATSLGFRASSGTAGGWNGGLGGESFNGYAGSGYGGGSAGGGGGGGTRASGTTNVTGAVGGGGGGGGARWGAGGGAGFVTVGAGGHGASGYDGASGSGATGGNGGGGANNVGGGGGGGGTYGDANLAQIFFGSGGGADGNSSSGDGCWDPGGISGRGGGIIFIMANTLTNSGNIRSRGQTSTGTPCTTNASGTGGSIKLFASTATLSNTVSAIAGTAGPSSSVGRIAVGASSVTGSSTPDYTAITAP